jgi:peptidyl-prolyl cis-trans isomerase D
MPERRVLRYALISREQAAANAAATPQEVEAFYRQNQARYAGAETRNLQQVVFLEEAQARQFVARAGGGANFVQAATQAGRSASDVALGAQTREQFTNVSSPQVASAVFGAQQGQMVGPIRSPLGWHVVRVESVTPAVSRPLDSVRQEIATEIGRRKAEEALAALLGRIEDRVAEGLSFEEVARAERLTVVETPPLTASGTAPGAQWQAPAEIPALVRGAFQLDPEDLEPTIETLAPNERFAFMAVARVMPAAVQPLQAVRDRVRADIVAQQATQRARQLADRIAAAINRGTPVAQAFAQAGVRLPAPQPIQARRLDLARRGAQVTPPLQALFSLPQGRARPVPAQNGVYVVAVVERTPGAATCAPGQQASGPQASEGCQAIELARGELRQTGGELTEQFARAARNAVEVTRNEDAIRSTRRRLQEQP